MNKDINNTEWIKSREDFVLFVEILSKNYTENKIEWENDTLETYLETMCGYAKDVNGYYKNTNQGNADVPTWKLFADIMLGAKIYE